MSRKGPLRRAWKTCREGALDRLGLLYGERFYTKSDRHKGASDRVVAETLSDLYRPRRVVDLGCGSGYFLAGFQRLGVEVYGLEKSRAGLRRCAAAGIPATPFDLRRDWPPSGATGELALCFEVAEHLEARWSRRLVELVTTLAPRAIFTAAMPGQGGVRHVNEQPPEYWIERFIAVHWGYRAGATEDLRRLWAERGVVSWLVTNVMVFERADR